ncbi:hypothetical protein [Gracilibacillus sp. YIM 98692]|uniref:hypothetical protein n=1 Tax=Gracilibacillus sp. YIM 98692 TaxID=2663532 RepID=UPI0013D870B0|nr:hypothetical protein [Gracilibacillus sp. YIM 98692]
MVIGKNVHNSFLIHHVSDNGKEILSSTSIPKNDSDMSISYGDFTGDQRILAGIIYNPHIHEVKIEGLPNENTRYAIIDGKKLFINITDGRLTNDNLQIKVLGLSADGEILYEDF